MARRRARAALAWLIAGAVAVAAWRLLTGARSAGDPAQQRRHAAPRLVGRSLGVALEPPDGWSAEEEQGRLEPYEAVRMRPPRAAGSPFTPVVTLRRRARPAEAGALTPAAGAAWYLSRLPDGAVIESQAPRIVAGVPADVLMIRYAMPPMARHGERAAGMLEMRMMAAWWDRGPFRYDVACTAARDRAGEMARACGLVLDRVEWLAAGAAPGAS